MNELKRIPLLHIDKQKSITSSFSISEERRKHIFSFLLKQSGELTLTELMKKVWDNPDFSDEEVVWGVYAIGDMHDRLR